MSHKSYSFSKTGKSLFYAERELAGAKIFYFLLYKELKNGETYNNHLVRYGNWMNINDI